MAVDYSEIEHFYKNKTILLTGATGFVGKLVLEKILRRLPVKHVYVLLRSKDEKDAESRCAEIFDSLAFDPLKRINEEFYKKVSLLLGDLSQPNLGLTDYDQNLIINEVECIFHCGGATKLDENPKTSVLTNVRGTRDILTIAKKANKLAGFVYLSSVYSNFPKYEVHEQFYEPPISAEKLISLCESSSDFKSSLELLMGDWPNIYTFTLSINEDLLKREGKGLPISIIRPSHILPPMEEPISGYVDKSFGLIEHSAAHAMGVNRVNYYKEGTLDVIPVDFVVNLIITSGWYCGLQNLRMKRGDITNADINIYHCISSYEKPISKDEWMGMVHTTFRDSPTSKMIRLPLAFNTACYYNYKLITYVLHYLMGFMCDFGLKFIGKQPVVVQMFDKLHRSQEVLTPYLFKEWYFDNENTQKLLKRMSFKDRHVFNFDVFTINWQDYFVWYVKGVRVYLLKDPMSTLSEGRKKQEKKLKMQLISTALLIIIVYVISKFLLLKVLY